MEDSNQQKDEDTLLTKEGWYLGELNEEAGRTVLETSGKYNVFIVHKTDDGGYILSARFPVEGTQDGVVEHLSIIEEGERRMRIEGQDTVHNSLKEAVTDYTSKRDPPLSPALRKIDFGTQSSIVSIQAPPTYDIANKQLQPDIAPLPKIDNVTTDNLMEAKTGRISPITGSLQYNRYDSYGRSRRDRVDTPPYMSNPHWYRYRDKSCCHPKNTWHCCCHRDTVWNSGRGEELNYDKWYDCRGTGFCRCLLLILMWSFVWPIALVYVCYVLCMLVCYLCRHGDGYDD